LGANPIAHGPHGISHAAVTGARWREGTSLPSDGWSSASAEPPASRRGPAVGVFSGTCGGVRRSEIFILEKDAQPAASTGRPLEWQVLGVRIGVNVVCKWLRGRFKRALGLPWAAWSALPRRVISFDPFSRLHTDSSRTPCSVIGLRHRRNLFYWGNQEAATEAVSHAAAEIGLVVVKRIP
jgi:hypothetical protein